jgi:CRP-like cAMP-binding protein
LFYEGDIGENFYILLDGKVRLLISQRGSEESTFSEIAQLSSGQSFGELSLLKNQPRTATVICMQSCYFMTLSKENYIRLLGKSMSKMLEDKIEFLHSLKLLNRWSKRSIEKLSFVFHPRSFKQGEIIYSKDDPSIGAFVIITGEVELTIWNKSEKNLPKELKVALICEKDFFGDDEVLKDTKRKFNAKCVSKVLTTYFISKEDFLEKIDKDSLSNLVKSNKLRNSLRESRLDSVRNNRNFGIKELVKKERNTYGLSFENLKFKKRIIKGQPHRNLCLSQSVMKKIRKRSLVNVCSPTASILITSPIPPKAKSPSVFYNTNGFQPRGLPLGIFHKIAGRIRMKL